jgi:hypothetical protein
MNGEAPIDGKFGDLAEAAGVTRLVSADAQATLEQLKASPLLADGRLCLVGLSAIRHGMGARWAVRREMVYDHFQRTMQRQLGVHGFHLRISETDYLVAQPAVSRLAGQAFCLNCLREILHFFLGEALVANIVVHEVTDIGTGEISGRRLDVGRVEAAEKIEQASRPAPTPVSDAAPKLTSQDRWTPFVANDGRSLRASCQLEPVFQLGSFRRIGYRMTRRVLVLPNETALSLAEQRRLSSADVEKIDFATLARGLNRLQQQSADADRAPSLILPVSFVTLSSQRGRATLADFFRAAKESVKQGLICEVSGIEGVPPSALLAATSLIRPFCLFVVGRLAETPAAPLNVLKDAGLQGLSIECPRGLDSDAEFAAFAKAVAVGAKPVAKTVMFFGLAGPRQAAIAEVLGATHGSVAPREPKVQYVDDAAAQSA